MSLFLHEEVDNTSFHSSIELSKRGRDP